MALKIRKASARAKKRPFYRIVVADSRMPRDGRYIEKLGTYNPLLPKDHDDRLTLDLERAKHWISKVPSRPTALRVFWTMRVYGNAKPAIIRKKASRAPKLWNA